MPGGLHPREMRCLLFAGGSMFKENNRATNPTCLTDIMPTALHGLDHDRPNTMTGRVLAEALAENDHSPTVERLGRQTGRGNCGQFLDLVRVDEEIFPFEGGRREKPAPRPDRNRGDRPADEPSVGYDCDAPPR